MGRRVEERWDGECRDDGEEWRSDGTESAGMMGRRVEERWGGEWRGNVS